MRVSDEDLTMAVLKTKPTKQRVTAFLDAIDDERKRRDAFVLLDLMKQVGKTEPEMWGTSIVGFGRYRYKTTAGAAGEWFIAGFSPRKQNLTLYIMPGVERYPDLLARLGPHKTGKSCLYLKSLDDVHVPTLKAMVRRAFKDMRQPKVC
jgi:hypothetical protein